MGGGMADIKLPSIPPVAEWPLFPDALRARDIEVAKCVLEAAAKVLSATYLERQDGVYVELPSFDGGRDCANAIRNLEISHD